MADELPEQPGRVVARLARQVELAVATVDLTLSQYRVLGILGDGKRGRVGARRQARRQPPERDRAWSTGWSRAGSSSATTTRSTGGGSGST